MDQVRKGKDICSADFAGVRVGDITQWGAYSLWHQSIYSQKYVCIIWTFIFKKSKIVNLRIHRSLRCFIFQFLNICRCFQLKCKVHCNKGGLKFLKVLKIFRQRLSFLWKFSEHQKMQIFTIVRRLHEWYFRSKKCNSPRIYPRYCP